MSKIIVVDYGMGNLHSVNKALESVSNRDTKIMISSDPKQVESADQIVLPGQGAILGCMRHIKDLGLYDKILQAIKTKPFLAICVGPQLLMEYSEENGGVDGFGIFKGKCLKFSDELPKRTPPLKIPHMGWSQVQHEKPHVLWDGISNQSRFYFVHSYYLEPIDQSVVVGSCDYGHRFASALAKDNIFTTQCHPEKSSDVGLRLFKNFINWKI